MTVQHQTAHTTPSSGRLVRAGLVLAMLLAVNDALLVSRQLGDGDPVVIVILVCAVLTAVAVPFAWRGSGRGRHTVVVTRVLSALTGLPAFFVADGVVMAAVGIVLALIVAALVYSGSRSTS